MEMSRLTMEFLFAFTRVAGFLFLVPVLRNKSIPVMTKMILSMAIAVAVMDQIDLVPADNLLEFGLLLAAQAAIGITLALTVEIIFSAAKMAGMLLDLELGFSMGSIADPMTGHRSTVLANIFNAMFTMIFILLGGLEAVISGIAYSFSYIEPRFYIADMEFMEWMASIVMFTMTTAIKIALPLTASMFFLNFFMLIIGKSAPQINIFNNLFIVKIFVGIFLLVVCIPFIGDAFTYMSEELMSTFVETIEKMGEAK